MARAVQVIDDVSQDALYLVMEYVPGGTIMDYDAEERR
jgi:serine/threonine protein kinase